MSKNVVRARLCTHDNNITHLSITLRLCNPEEGKKKELCLAWGQWSCMWDGQLHTPTISVAFHHFLLHNTEKEKLQCSDRAQG